MARPDLSAQTVFAVTAVIGFLNAVARPVTVAVEKESAVTALLGGFGINPIVAASLARTFVQRPGNRWKMYEALLEIRSLSFNQHHG